METETLSLIIDKSNTNHFSIKPKLITEDNIVEKIDNFLNFIEGKKIKRPLSSLGKKAVINIFYSCLDLNITDLRMISYILATIYWETGSFNQRFLYEPKEEANKGKGKPYGFPHKKTGKVYYSRGYYPLTWFDDYERFTKILFQNGFEYNLLQNPDLVLDIKVATLIILIGMRDGKFTGRSLEDYFDPIKSDWYNARKTIKDLDKAVIIKTIAEEIYYIIK